MTKLLLIAALLACVYAGKINVKRRLGDGDELVTVVISYNPAVKYTRGYHVHSDFNRTVAKVETITKSELNAFLDDPLVDAVDEDVPAYPMSVFTEQGDELPWGISEVKADSKSIPAPDPSSDCFKICVVDTGVLVSHTDLVSSS